MKLFHHMTSFIYFIMLISQFPILLQYLTQPNYIFLLPNSKSSCLSPSCVCFFFLLLFFFFFLFVFFSSYFFSYSLFFSLFCYFHTRFMYYSTIAVFGVSGGFGCELRTSCESFSQKPGLDISLLRRLLTSNVNR